MLEKKAFKRFIALSKKKIIVEISDVAEYYEVKPGIWKDVDIEMGVIKYDKWPTVGAFEKYLKKEKSAILEEIEDNVLVILSPAKYLIQLNEEIKQCHNNFIKKEINNTTYNLYKNISTFYRPNAVYWTPEEIQEAKSSHESPIRSADLKNKENISILEYVSKYSDLQLNTLVDIYNYINEKIDPKGILPGTKLSDDKPTIVWNKTDTDLLELIAALIRSKSINNQTKGITRKEAIEYFSQLFGLVIKDAESKLTRSTNRKKNVARYLTILKDTLIDINWYNDKKIEPKSVFSENNSKSSNDKPFLIWDKSPADLLELITALFESKTITNSTNDLTIEKAIEEFSQFFCIEAKDVESDLGKSTDKDIKAPYLTFLISTFEEFAQDKEDRLDSLRR